MEWSIIKATPTVLKDSRTVVGWEVRVAVEHAGASAFDDLTLPVPQSRELAEWTAESLLDLFDDAVAAEHQTERRYRALYGVTGPAPGLSLLPKLRHLMSVVRFRATTETLTEFPLTQLGGADHVRLHSGRLQIE